ncbi:hypothetical protein AB4305_32795 [Nocardia sp. 2YAB30]|uniref:hypothetical protein n=1 Tax=Nocardia sp. 2YAB30 TaxID=3233022 RepID=UPI003F99E194
MGAGGQLRPPAVEPDRPTDDADPPTPGRPGVHGGIRGTVYGGTHLDRDRGIVAEAVTHRFDEQARWTASEPLTEVQQQAISPTISPCRYPLAKAVSETASNGSGPV